MQRSIIQDRIDNFDYQDALELIRDHGDNTFAERYLKMNRSTFTEKKVLLHLQEWKESLTEFVNDFPENLTINVKTENANTLEELKSTRNKLVAERDHLRGQLELIPTDQERKEVAERIVDTTKTILDIWEDINTLNAGKELPKEEPDDELETIFEGASPIQLEKIRKNYISYLSKARKGKRPKDKIPFYQSVISEAERRIRELV